MQRGNVRIPNLQALNTILYVVEHGCKRRELPQRFGDWHTLYTRMNRWSKSGALDRVFAALREENILRVRLEVLALVNASVESLSRTRYGCIPTGRERPEKAAASRWPVPGRLEYQGYSGCADDRRAVTFALSPGEGRPTTDRKAGSCWAPGATAVGASLAPV